MRLTKDNLFEDITIGSLQIVCGLSKAMRLWVNQTYHFFRKASERTEKGGIP
jgi:DNA-binding transcriptional regulator/RsmH inhibitor MraZ